MEPQNTNPSGNSKKIGIGIAVIAVLALIGITVAANKNSASQSVPADATDTTNTVPVPAATTTTALPPATTGQTTTKTTALYKDGTYTATGSYMSPGGNDQLGVSVTLKNDIITDATVTPMAGDRTSARYQTIFADNYKQYVVGQDITKLNIHKVSGSSLTSEGFNDAIAQIEVKAKA